MSSIREAVAALGRTSSYSGQAREVLANALSVALYPLGVSGGVMEAALGALPGRPTLRHVTTPVVVVHGYGANQSLNARLTTSLWKNGFVNVRSLNYLPFAGEGVPAVGRLLERAVRNLLAETGGERVHLVGHSAGGIVIREAMARRGLDEVVGTAITVASPHRGAPGGRLASILGGRGPLRFASQIATDSDYLRGLDEDSRAGAAEWVAYRSNLDLVVPERSARLELPALNARNVLVKDEGHVSLMLSRKLVASVTQDLLGAEWRQFVEGTVPLRPAA